MDKLISKRGFTVVELLIALSILGLVLSLTISAVNWKDRKATDLATELMGHFTSMELAVSLFYNNTNGYPTGLDDASLVPSYLFSPKAPVGFNRTFGTDGYYLGQQTGMATASDNGHYLCASVDVTDGNDAKFVALTMVKEKTPTGKFFYNTADCTVNGQVPLSYMADPVAPATIYLAYWLTRD